MAVGRAKLSQRLLIPTPVIGYGKVNASLLHPPFLGVIDMAETVISLDARVTDDSALGAFYIVLAARKSDGPGVGHAFVVWGVEDAKAQMSSTKAYGFYPDGAGKAVFGADVPGFIVNEATKGPTHALLTSRVIVRVNKSEYEASQQLIVTWATQDYNLYNKNCVFFTKAVAEQVGLLGLPDPTAQLPVDYYAAAVATVRTAYGGKWRTNDAEKRFSLEVGDGRFRWTEYRGAQQHALDIRGSSSSKVQRVVLERPNEDSVLQFLGFSSAALRAQIIAAKPEPSTLTLTRSGAVLQAVWRGLLVTKKPDGSLNQIVQPSAGTSKTYVFDSV